MRRRAVFAGAVFFLALLPRAEAAEMTLDFSSGCKLYRLDPEGKKWVETDGELSDGFGIPPNQILRDEAFTVFATNSATYGVNRRCLRAGAEAPTPRARRSPWSAVFSVGYDLASNAELATTYLGASRSEAVKLKRSFSFLGEANYRASPAFRVGLEIGLSQIAVDAAQGNETSFIDARPEYVFRAGSDVEIYGGPMVGVFFFSQNSERRALTGANAGREIGVDRQTATALLLGFGLGADYALNAQFDLGVFFRYFRPGDLKISGTEISPTAGNLYVAKLALDELASGLRFAIHF